jgi:uncharacterized sulfatase
MNGSAITRRTALSIGAPALLGQTKTATKRRPNIVLVVMDDFGIGSFAPHAQTIEAKDFDPSLTDYLRRRNAGYTPEEALRHARNAMPVMSQLSKTGVYFANAFSSSNLCAPSRTGILTGRLQNRFGLYQNSDVERAGLPANSALAIELRKAGYSTNFVGKWHVGRRDESLREAVLRKRGVTAAELPSLPEARRNDIEAEIRRTGYLGAIVREHHALNHGFDRYFGYNRWECPFYNSEHVWDGFEYAGLQSRYNTELFTERAIDNLGAAKREGKPAFVQISYHAVHGPLKPKAPERHFEKFASGSYDLTNFYAHVNAVDAGIAAIRDSLGAEWENTLFLFTADNVAPADLATPLPANAPYAGHKGQFVQGGMRVPMLMHWPAGFRGGSPRREIVSNLDLMPTALEAAQVAAPSGLDGRSALPLLAGKTKSVHDHLVLAGIHARAWGFTKETVIGDFQKRREESPGAWVVTDGRYTLRRTTTIKPGLYRDLPDGQPARYELFDIREDPRETRDLSAQVPQVVESLKKVYEREARNFQAPAVWGPQVWPELKP